MCIIPDRHYGRWQVGKVEVREESSDLVLVGGIRLQTLEYCDPRQIEIGVQLEKLSRPEVATCSSDPGRSKRPPQSVVLPLLGPTPPQACRVSRNGAQDWADVELLDSYVHGANFRFRSFDSAIVPRGPPRHNDFAARVSPHPDQRAVNQSPMNIGSIPVTSKSRGRDSLLVRRRPGQAETETGIMPLWAWVHLERHSTLADGDLFPDLEISCHFTRKARQNERALASLKTGRKSQQRTGSSPSAALRA